MRLYNSAIAALVAAVLALSSAASQQNAGLVLDAAGGPRTAVFSAANDKAAQLLLRRLKTGEPEIFIAVERKGETLTGRGRLLADGRFSATVAPLGEDKKNKSSAHVLSGVLKGKTLNLEWRNDDGGYARESWMLTSFAETKQLAVTEPFVKPGGWTEIARPAAAKGRPVRLRVTGLKHPVGGAFQKPPVAADNLKADFLEPLLSKADFANPSAWLPDYIDEDGASVWLIDGGAPFWITDLGVALGQFQPRIRWEAIWPDGFPVFRCDPTVDIEVTPKRIARGESVRITVTAASEAGIDQVNWSVVSTPEPTSRGESIPARGETAFSHTSSLTLNTPGEYRLRGNASSYGEGGASCYDYEWVEVSPDARRAYKIAYVVLTNEPDTGSPAFREKLRRANEAKRKLRREFQKATDFTGAVDISYPTVVMAPPRAFIRNSDGEVAVYNFFRDVTQSFYRSHPDDFDFIAYWTDIPDRLETFPGGFVQVRAGEALGGRHFTVRTAVSGLGLGYRNNTASWGSAGRLRGVGALRDVGELPADYSYQRSFMLLALHELFGHQWGVYAAALADAGSHFKIGLQSDTYSVLYAQPWRALGGGRYRIEDIPDSETGYHTIKFHPWALYLAGLKRRDEIPANVLKVTLTPPWEGNRWVPVEGTGSAETITMDSVIAAEGDRRDH